MGAHDFEDEYPVPAPFVPPVEYLDSDTPGVYAIKQEISRKAREAYSAKLDGDTSAAAANRAYRQEADAKARIEWLYRELVHLTNNPAPPPPAEG